MQVFSNLFNLDSLFQKGFQLIKKLIFTSPLSRFIAVISAPPSSPAQLHAAQETAVIIVLFNPHEFILFSSSISTSKFWNSLRSTDCRGCVNHPPPTACCSPAGSQIETVFINQRLHERMLTPFVFLQNAWVVTKSVSINATLLAISLQNQCIVRGPARFYRSRILQCDLITAEV